MPSLSLIPSKRDLEQWKIPHALDLHPTLPPVTEQLMEQLGMQRGAEFLIKRHKAILAEKENPLDSGWRLPLWGRIERDIAAMRMALPDDVIMILVLGGNRAGKSEGAARMINRLLRDKPGASALHLHSKRGTAVDSTMKCLYRSIPREWRPAPGKASTGRSPVHRVSYSQGTGFADDNYVFPNESSCKFGYYGNDLSSVEGPEYDIIWADELIPLTWVKTLRFRLATRRGVFIITFTPVEGWSPTVAHFVNGATTLASSPLLPPESVTWDGDIIGRHAHELPVYAENGLLGYGEMLDIDGRQVLQGLPRVQQALDPASRIYYAWTVDNPYSPYETTAKLARPGGVPEIKVRLYGMARRLAGVRFSLTAAHVLPSSRMAALPRTGQFFHIVDPCEGRTWVMWWVYLVGRQAYVLREFPQPGCWPFAPVGVTQDMLASSPELLAAGEWVTAEPPGETKKVLVDGYRGPAQYGLTWGLTHYRDEILRIERELFLMLNPESLPERPDKIIPMVRIMDSRAGNMPTMSASEATTLIQQMATLPGGEPLYFMPAGGGRISEGLTLLDDWLAYKRDEPVNALNAPRLMIHENCRNTLRCFGMWTGADGGEGASKDFIDLASYFAKACPAVPESAGAQPHEGSGW